MAGTTADQPVAGTAADQPAAGTAADRTGRWFPTGEVGPGPGEAPLVVPGAAALLRRNATDPAIAGRPAVLFGDTRWTHQQYVTECRRWAAAFAGWRPVDGPFHVGVLLDNTPAYLAAFGAAGLSGAALVGLNPTRRGAQLLRDIAQVDLCALITEPRYAPLLTELGHRLPVPAERTFTVRRWVAADDPDPSPGWPELEQVLPEQPADWLDPAPGLASSWCLIFTSGTSAAPKAVICSQRRLLVTGERLRRVLDVTGEDVGYLCMPLFHSNSLMVGLMPALLAGAAVALRRKFSASGWLPDVRRYGVTYWNYTGKPLAYLLATPEQADDADNPLRRAYGNEGSDALVRRFADRFGVRVLDAFGPTEGGVGIVRGDDDPPGSIGHGHGVVAVVDESGRPLPPARFDGTGRLLNADECVGEIVNTAGPGPFEGYYNNPEATRQATRGGWYWSGDLGYADQAGYLYFAGRTADWLRVDGENFPAGPIEAVLNRHPDLLAAAVYGVPDAQAGDQVMAAVVPRPGTRFDPAEFARWVDGQPDLGPKWRPRYLRLAADLPRTPTQKVLHRVLQRQKFRRDLLGDDPLYVRDPDGGYQPFTAEDELTLHRQFTAAGRERFWDL